MNEASAQPKRENGKPVPLLSLSDVRMKSVDWLWPGRIVRGKLNLIAGDPEAGKSMITADLAARVTTGALWPDGSPNPTQGDVLMVSTEDGVDDTTAPRLRAAGADLSRVKTLKLEAGALPSLADLLATIKAMKPVLVVLDPLTTSVSVGKMDSKQDHDVRQSLLTPLAQVADQTGTTIVGVKHLNKDEMKKALYRVSDSVAFVAVPRSVLLALDDTSNTGQRYLIPLKLNVGKKALTLKYGIETASVGGSTAPIATARIEWKGSTDLTAGDLLAVSPGTSGPKAAPKLEAGLAFLNERLRTGPKQPGLLKKEAKARGICSEAHLDRAAKSLGVKSETAAGGVDLWALPAAPKPVYRSDDERRLFEMPLD